MRIYHETSSLRAFKQLGGAASIYLSLPPSFSGPRIKRARSPSPYCDTLACERARGNDVGHPLQCDPRFIRCRILAVARGSLPRAATLNQQHNGGVARVDAQMGS